MVNRKYRQLQGQRFGYLVALRRAGRVRGNAGWLCHCDCGQEVVVASDRLTLGRRKACTVNGHRFRANPAPSFANRFPSEYQSWESMRERCKNKKHRNWKYYGGAGVRVCERWARFEQFFKDMGPKPTPEHTIDRFPNGKGNYEPGNCRWATQDEQTRNRGNLVKVIYEGVEVLLIDVVAKLGLKRGVVYGRLKMGWSLEDALSVPLIERKKKTRRKRRVVAGTTEPVVVS